jgi:hypothetical protein
MKVLLKGLAQDAKHIMYEKWYLMEKAILQRLEIETENDYSHYGEKLALERMDIKVYALFLRSSAGGIF